MNLLRKIGLGAAALVFSVSTFVISGDAQTWRVWRGNQRRYERRDDRRWRNNNIFWNNRGWRERHWREERREHRRDHRNHKW